MPTPPPAISGTIQNRSYVRVDVSRLPAAVWLCQPRVATRHDSRILNLSGDGAFVEVDTRGMAPGAEIQFIFDLPGGRRVSVSGRVVRVQAAEPHDPAAPRNRPSGTACALRFVFARESERDRLVAWVFAALAQSRRQALAQPLIELSADADEAGISDSNAAVSPAR